MENLLKKKLAKALKKAYLQKLSQENDNIHAFYQFSTETISKNNKDKNQQNYFTTESKSPRDKYDQKQTVNRMKVNDRFFPKSATFTPKLKSKANKIIKNKFYNGQNLEISTFDRSNIIKLNYQDQKSYIQNNIPNLITLSSDKLYITKTIKTEEQNINQIQFSQKEKINQLKQHQKKKNQKKLNKNQIEGHVYKNKQAQSSCTAQNLPQTCYLDAKKNLASNIKIYEKTQIRKNEPSSLQQRPIFSPILQKDSFTINYTKPCIIRQRTRQNKSCERKRRKIYSQNKNKNKETIQKSQKQNKYKYQQFIKRTNNYFNLIQNQSNNIINQKKNNNNTNAKTIYKKLIQFQFANIDQNINLQQKNDKLNHKNKINPLLKNIKKSYINNKIKLNRKKQLLSETQVNQQNQCSVLNNSQTTQYTYQLQTKLQKKSNNIIKPKIYDLNLPSFSIFNKQTITNNQFEILQKFEPFRIKSSRNSSKINNFFSIEKQSWNLLKFQQLRQKFESQIKHHVKLLKNEKVQIGKDQKKDKEIIQKQFINKFSRDNSQIKRNNLNNNHKNLSPSQINDCGKFKKISNIILDYCQNI